MSSPTVHHRFSLTRPLLMIVVLFVALLPVAAFAASVENETPGSEVRSEPPAQPHAPTATLVVTNTHDSGIGSLRQVLNDANASPGADTITFAIGAVGSQQTISPTSPLPIITDPLTIDGWSQGGAGYSGAPLIEIDGALAGDTRGLVLDAGSDGSLVCGLAITRFAYNGLQINSSYNKIQGNYIGLGLDGVTAQGNGDTGSHGSPDRWAGIFVYSGLDNLIGTDSDGTLDAAERNVISGNTDGIDLSYAISNVVAGNYIGTDASGLNAEPNLSVGVFVEGNNNRIGTDGNGVADAAERNIISGNSGAGLFLRFSLSNTIAGNYVGLNVNGDPLGNGNPSGEGAGIVVGASHYNIIGTDGSPDAFNANERNVIAATVGDTNLEYGDGIQILDATNNVVAGNYIGVNEAATTTVGYGNEHTGITLYYANSNRIGTNADGVADADEANIIGGNNGALWLRESMSNTIASNLIGTDATGTLDLGNYDGIGVQNSSYNLIGGAEPAARNIIRNTFDPAVGTGIVLLHDDSTGPDAARDNRIIGNLIADNARDGIASFPTEYPSAPPGDGPADNFIISNTIQHNGYYGIYNAGSSPSIRANIIVSNSSIGIYNEVYMGFDSANAGDDYLSRPDILSNTISDNCNGWNGWPPYQTIGCAGILSLDTAPNNAATLETDNAPAPNSAYPFIDQLWYGAVEVIKDGVPITSTVGLGSANGGPICSFSTTTGPCPAYNNTILHGGPGISCDNELTWPIITQYIVDDAGVRHNYMPVTSSSPVRAVYSFDADAATDPTDTGAGFIGEGIQTGPFSRYQIMQITITDQPIISLTVISDSPTVLGSPTHFTATVASGTNITYTWDFGDGSTIVSGPSSIVSHTYGAVGAYTATVTATNSISTAVAATPVTIICAPGTVVLNTDDAGCGSLRNAVSAALPGDAITFTSTLAGQVITLTSGEIGIDKPLTIDGASAPGVAVSGNNASRIFSASGGALTVNNLILTQGYTEGAGGAIFASVPLTLSSVSIISNTAYGGGGVYMDGTYVDGAFTITGSQFLSNTAGWSGGGLNTVNIDNATATLINVTFISNTAEYGGGGMANSGSSPTLTNVTFISNTAGYDGGGMANSVSNPTLINVTFFSNFAGTYGGGMVNRDGSSPTLTNVTFISNTAGDRGGGMANYSGSSPTFINVTFTGNFAYSVGGGMDSGDSALTLVNVTFNANFAGYYSHDGVGGMESFQSVLTLTNVTFNANPGGMVNLASNFTVANSTFTGNDYALFNTLGSTGTVTNSILWGNTGDQIYNNDSDSVLTVTYSDVQGGYPGLGNLDADPHFGPLGNYGGFVDTIPLLAGSAAIDSGDDAACPASDARGVTRPQGRHCDLGAFESPYTLTLTAANSSPTVLGSPTAFTATLNTSLAPITYTWDLGEGSLGSGQSLTWTYAASGMYTAVVTATTDAITLTAATRVTITDQPISSLTVSNDSPTALGHPTHFTATASGSNITYTWNFGDSSPVVGSSSSVISHTYNTVGPYTAIVTATNSVSSVAATTPVTITDQPISSLTVSNDSPTVLGSVTHFTATASGSNITYTWNFGDNSPVVGGSSSIVLHTYSTSGNYTTVVTAANSVSNASAQTIVLIASLPVAEAGADQITHPGQSAILNGGASLDPGGYLPLTYHWQQTGGQVVALSSTDHVTVTFTTPRAVTRAITLTFALTVTNTLNFASPPDFVTVTVEPHRIYLPLALK